MWFFGELLIHGMLSGSVYALISLAFVVVYKASRMINFALGEFIMLASKLVATGLHALGLGWFGGIVFGCAGMVAFAIGFNRWVLRRLIGQPLISFIMVTIGLGIVNIRLTHSNKSAVARRVIIASGMIGQDVPATLYAVSEPVGQANAAHTQGHSVFG